MANPTPFKAVPIMAPIVIKKQDAVIVKELIENMRRELMANYGESDKKLLLKQVDQIKEIALLEKEHQNVVSILSNMLGKVSDYQNSVLRVLELRRKLINLFTPVILA